MIRDTEAAFVRMIANRTLRMEQDAIKNGETFHNTYAPIEVLSGHRVRLRHGPTTPVVEIYPTPNGFGDLSACTILASEVLAHPAKLHSTSMQHLEFVPDTP